MKKKLISLLLTLTLCLGLALPALAVPGNANLPDWYFLFAIFKNLDADVKDRDGNAVHIKYSMPQEEVDLTRALAAEFEEYMNSVGVIRAHVDVIEVDAPVTEFYNEYGGGSYLSAELAAPLLKVDLDRYDHVSCFFDLDVNLSYAGISPSGFENGTGISCNNHVSWERTQKSYRDQIDRNLWHIQLYVHEFLHFMEKMSSKWGETFTLHRDGKTHYTRDNDWKSYYTDVILNRLDGDLDVFPDGGTGVHPAAWQYPPHVLRTITELTVPSGVTSISRQAFMNCTTLTRVTLPSTVTRIEFSAFRECSNLTEVTISSGTASIAASAFSHCTNLKSISIPASVTTIEDWAFGDTGLKDVYYGGTEAQWQAIQIGSVNGQLTNANIHYNSLMADVKTTDWFARGVTWAMENSVTAGTGEGRFSPNDTCTQAQILTFLWRAMGLPAPSGTVRGSEYYAVPFQWAKEQGVTGGTVNPNAPCTRADVVTYLWRLAGSPAAKAASFSDVPAEASYAKAVGWALEKGVTAGVSATQFGPDSTCTRSQIVTFLYAALAG